MKTRMVRKVIVGAASAAVLIAGLAAGSGQLTASSDGLFWDHQGATVEQASGVSYSPPVHKQDKPPTRIHRGLW